MLKKVLLTSVCRPLGPNVGDAPSVGYETQAAAPRALFAHRLSLTPPFMGVLMRFIMRITGSGQKQTVEYA